MRRERLSNHHIEGRNHKEKRPMMQNKIVYHTQKEQQVKDMNKKSIKEDILIATVYGWQIPLAAPNPVR